MRNFLLWLLVMFVLSVALTNRVVAQLLLLGIGTTTTGGCTNNILMETGDDLLLETSDCITIE